jgi:Skp family chaperone for outer membrane proteins
MNRHWAMMAIAILLCVSVASIAQAQALPQGQPQSPRGAAGSQALQGTRIASLDVNFVFKNHERFKAALDGMKRSYEAAEEEVKKDSENINKAREALQDFHKGTPEYKAREEDLLKKQAELQTKVQLKKNELVQREAENYNAVYQEILQETQSFCKANAIDMVVRINNEPANLEQPNSVLGYINRQVVWSDSSLDITLDILQRLNSRGGAAANPASANRAAAPGTRPTVPFRDGSIPAIRSFREMKSFY